MGFGGQLHASVALPQNRAHVPIVQEAGLASQPVWSSTEHRAPTTWVRSPERPLRGESL